MKNGDVPLVLCKRTQTNLRKCTQWPLPGFSTLHDGFPPCDVTPARTHTHTNTYKHGEDRLLHHRRRLHQALSRLPRCFHGKIRSVICYLVATVFEKAPVSVLTSNLNTVTSLARTLAGYFRHSRRGTGGVCGFDERGKFACENLLTNRRRRGSTVVSARLWR